MELLIMAQQRYEDMEKNNNANSERFKRVKAKIEDIQDTAALLKEVRERREQAQRNEELDARKAERENLGKNKKTDDNFDINRIIREGSIEEKAAAVIRSQDFEKLGIKSKLVLTRRQMSAINKSITDKKDRELFMSYLKLYTDLFKYQRELFKFVKVYQVGIGILAKEVTKWDEYNKMAETLSYIYSGKDEAEVQEELKKLEPIINNELVQYKYDQEKKSVVADIFRDGGLYKRIKEAQENAEEYLAMVKSSIIVVEDFLYSNNYFFVFPMAMEMDVDRIKNETFSRLLIDKKHHLSEVNYKKIDKGLPVSPEEELLAVVPDYYEVKPDEEFLEFCKNGFKQIREKNS